jgi:hypothetical protein
MMSSLVPVAETKGCALLAGNEGRPVRRMWLRLVLFLLPIFVFLGPIIYAVDPYALFQHRSVVPDDVRRSYGLKVDSVLWKLIDYDRHPEPNIMLGDSQMDHLNAAAVSSATGESYTNLAYSGGSLRESIDTFWFASRRINLRHVYFQIAFMTYNSMLFDRVPRAEESLRNPLYYFMSSDVLEAGAYDIGDAYFHYSTGFSPEMSKEAFWQSQLRYLEVRYKRDSDPGPLREELKRIVYYCKSHGISLVFVITPQSVDAQREVELLGIEEKYRRFKSDLERMAPVYDCDIETSFTVNKNNFSDPFHLEHSAAQELVVDLWSGHSRLCRTLVAH